MKKYYIYILLAIAPLVFSCENWFDVQPKSQVKSDDLFEAENGFKRALIGVYTLMADNEAYGANGTMAFMEVLGGTYTSVKNRSHNFHEISKYDYEHTDAVKMIKQLWSNNYTSIANINNLLENIDAKQDVFSEGIYEIIKGEALALRAYIHFDLLRNFAPAPINGLGQNAIPYVDAVTVNPFPQLTVGQLLDRVIADLEQAEKLLKDYDPIGPAFDSYEEQGNGWTPTEEAAADSNFLLFRKERMNYYAVIGTLARVYLYKGTEEAKTKAYNYANDVIQSSKIQLNESTLVNMAEVTQSVNTLMAKEYLFSLYKRNLSEEVNEKYFYFNSLMNNDDLSIDEATRNEYYETSKYGGVADIRYNYLFSTNLDGLSKYLSKYNFGQFNLKRIPLLKLSEMYLIVAETGESMDDLKYLRRMRGLKNMAPGTTLTEEIAAEYRKEFVGEGQIFYYYKRLNQLVNNDMTNAGKFVLPIPDEELERGIINLK